MVRSDVEGWDVRRAGEAQALSNYATRELAEEAARKQQEAEDRAAATPTRSTCARTSSPRAPRRTSTPKKTFLGMGAVMIGVIAADRDHRLIVALTDFAVEPPDASSVRRSGGIRFRR